MRARHLFAGSGLLVAVVDAPSDRQDPPYLGGFRQTAGHAEDMKAVIAWLRREAGVPVWLVGTSRGTQSAAFVAAQLAPEEGGPDGLVLTSTILTDKPGNRPVQEMPLGRIRVPTLVVHHPLRRLRPLTPGGARAARGAEARATPRPAPARPPSTYSPCLRPGSRCTSRTVATFAPIVTRYPQSGRGLPWPA